MSRYLKNSAICLACNKEIESTHRHNFVSCGCPNQTFVDGGLDYIRRGAVDISLIKDTSIERKEKQKFDLGDIVLDMANGARYLVTAVNKDEQSYNFKVLYTPSLFKGFETKTYTFYMANRDLEKEA